MKSDRFLTSILVGIAVLAVLAVVLFFVRQGGQAYTGDNSPQGVVQDYLLAVSQDNFDLAYQSLAQMSPMPTLAQFQQYFLNSRQSTAGVSVQVGETSVAGDQASVMMVFIQPDSSPFGTASHLQQMASLTRQNGAWKITQMPYPFWDYSWAQPIPAGKPVQPLPAPLPTP